VHSITIGDVLVESENRARDISEVQVETLGQFRSESGAVFVASGERLQALECATKYELASVVAQTQQNAPELLARVDLASETLRILKSVGHWIEEVQQPMQGPVIAERGRSGEEQ